MQKMQKEEERKKQKEEFYPLKKAQEAKIKSFLDALPYDNYFFICDFRDGTIDGWQLSDTKTNYKWDWKGIMAWTEHALLNGDMIGSDTDGVADFMKQFGDEFLLSIEKDGQLFLFSNIKLRSKLIGSFQ